MQEHEKKKQIGNIDVSRLPNKVENLECPDCGAKMKIRVSKKFFRPNGEPKLFYGCTRYPECRGMHSAKDCGMPMGNPADQETRAARREAHEVLDRLWKKSKNKCIDRAGAYIILRHIMGLEEDEAHISMMSKEQCLEFVRRIRTMNSVHFAGIISQYRGTNNGFKHPRGKDGFRWPGSRARKKRDSGNR